MADRIHGPYIGDPWDQQPDEPNNLWNRFCWYLDQDPGNRSLKAVGEQFGVDKSTVSTCADRYRWVERAALYDAHRVNRRRDHIARQELALAEQQIATAVEATDVLARSVHAVAENGAFLDPKDMPNWAKMIETLRKMALDRPDQVVELTGAEGGPIQISEFEGLSPAQMKDRAAEMASSVLRVVNGGKAS